MNPFDIYAFAYQWKTSSDRRPWLILEQHGVLWGCFPFSTKAYSGHSVEIDENHPDFPATGLAESCYLYDDTIVDIPAGVIQSAEASRKGRLENELLNYVLTETGLEHLHP